MGELAKRMEDLMAAGKVEEARELLDQYQQTAEQAAMAGLFARNMSHNIGEHITEGAKPSEE